MMILLIHNHLIVRKLSADHNHQHLKWCLGLKGIGNIIGWNNQHFAGGTGLRLAADGDFSLAVQDIDHRIKKNDNAYCISMFGVDGLLASFQTGYALKSIFQ